MFRIQRRCLGIFWDIQKIQIVSGYFANCWVIINCIPEISLNIYFSETEYGETFFVYYYFIWIQTKEPNHGFHRHPALHWAHFLQPPLSPPSWHLKKISPDLIFSHWRVPGSVEDNSRTSPGTNSTKTFLEYLCRYDGANTYSSDEYFEYLERLQSIRR